LDDTPDFDGAFVFDEFADGVEEVGGELHPKTPQSATLSFSSGLN
jgi:hypothetical protein